VSRDLATQAIRLAEELGAPVFPVRVFPDPVRPGRTLKQPLVAAWQNGGSAREADAIEALFRAHRGATHVGIVTGSASRLLLIDLDGAQAIEWWRANESLLPPTRTVKTQREDGRHLFYRLPVGVELKNSAGTVAPGVDVRATGGFACDWSRDSSEQFLDVADAPAALIELLRGRAPDVKRRQEVTTTPTRVPPEVVADLRSALAHLRADDYDLFIAVGHALKELGDTGRGLWIEWAQTSDKWRPKDARRWTTFDGSRTGYAAVFAKAQAAGWVNPRGNAAQIEPPAPSGDVLPYTLAGDIGEDDVQGDEQVVEDILGTQANAEVYGESGTGKSALATHMALCIASGRAFFGHGVKQGGVLYIAAEGAQGLRKRIVAARLAHDLPCDLPLAVITASVRLTERDARRIIATARELEEKTGVRVVLIIFDTLARVMEGDENSTQDMSAAVRAVDKVREALTEASTLLVHHAGKDVTKGARGSSALRAAVDTELCVSGRRNPRTLSVEKQRDIEPVPPVTFTLEAEQVGIDKNGAPITAAVVREGRPVQREASRPKGPNPTQLLVELQRLQVGSDAMLTWSRIEAYTVAKAIGIKKSSASLAAINLIDNGCLVEAGGERYRLADFQERSARSAAFSLNETEHGPPIVQPFRGSMTLNALNGSPELNGSSDEKPKRRAASRNGQAGRKQGRRKGGRERNNP